MKKIFWLLIIGILAASCVNAATSFTPNYGFRDPEFGDLRDDIQWSQNQDMKDIIFRNLLLRWNWIEEPPLVTHTTGLGITWDDGDVVVKKNEFHINSGSGAVNASPSVDYVIPNYVYVNESGVVTISTTVPSAQHFALMAIVDTNTTGVVNIWYPLKLRDTSFLPEQPTGVETTGGVSGITLSYDGDADHDINVTAGACFDSRGLHWIKLDTEITKQIDAAWSEGNDSGGLLDYSVSAVAANTVYDIYLIKKNDGTVDVGLISNSRAIASYLPANYPYYRWIGFVRTDADADMYRFYHSDDTLWFGTYSSFTVNSGVSTIQYSLTGQFPAGRVKEWLVSSYTFVGGDYSFIYVMGGNAHAGLISATAAQFNSEVSKWAPITREGNIFLFTSNKSQTFYPAAVRIIR